MKATVKEEKQADVVALRLESGLVMKKSDIERYLTDLKKKGRTAETLSKYRRTLEQLYQALPEDKTIRRGTLAEWKEELVEKGYSNSSVNAALAACDCFLDFMECRELQMVKRMSLGDRPQPELTRAEYLRLLAKAKALGDEKLYLMVKSFASTGLHVNELADLTIADVKSGQFMVTFQGIRRLVHVPECLVKELLAYAERQGIQDGLLFRSKRGKAMNRCNITLAITKLCKAADVPEEKGNPKALRKLYLSTWDSIMASMQLLMEQSMDRQIEEEQTLVGWET